MLMNMSPRLFLRTRRQHGQGMTEYIVIVALVAVAAIAVYQYFGKTVRNQTAAIANEIAGSDGTAAKNAAKTAAGTASTEADSARTLDTYTGNTAR
jgi:type IV pilus assembly protein PilA